MAGDPVQDPVENSLETKAENASDDPIEAAQTPETAPTATSPARRSGLSVAAGLILGGVLAAILGFAAARTIVPEGWPFPGATPQPDPLAQAQAEQARQLQALRDQIAALGDRLDQLEAKTQTDSRATAQQVADLQSALEAANQRLTQLADMLTALDARLLAIEKLPQGSGSEAADAAARAYERELARMREMLADELARIEARQQAAQETGQTAEEQAQAAALRAAMAELRADLNAGKPFADPLATLAQASGEPAPQALASVADTGIATLAHLQEIFPNAARAALSASIDALVQDGKISRIEGFLRSQLGTRSLEPRPGDDPDAVLSRAEAALKDGDLTTALAELDALPEAGRTKMSDWIRQARTRLAAMQAADALAARLNLQ